MISDSEYLERIVAGINSVTTQGAEVKWNERLNGRQFDVVVRFKVGTLRYLVLIEVKNRKRKACVSDVEAFVIKARAENASKSVFVTSAGFQSGAIKVAKQYGVELFQVSFDESQVTLPKDATYFALVKKGALKVPPKLAICDPVLVTAVEKARLFFVDGRKFNIPSEQSQMTYYLNNTKLIDGRTLSDVIKGASISEGRLDVSKMEKVAIEPPQFMQPPDTYFYPPGNLASMTLKVTGRMARPIEGNLLIDPNLFTAPVVYTNVISGDSVSFELGTLPLGVSRVREGEFYFTYNPLAYFFCESVIGDLVHWYVVESFQNGEIIQARTTQDKKYSSFYIPVSDKKILGRLNDRLEKLRNR